MTRVPRSFSDPSCALPANCCKDVIHLYHEGPLSYIVHVDGCVSVEEPLPRRLFAASTLSDWLGSFFSLSGRFGINALNCFPQSLSHLNLSVEDFSCGSRCELSLFN
jgi:hypothetical protein